MCVARVVAAFYRREGVGERANCFTAAFAKGERKKPTFLFLRFENLNDACEVACLQQIHATCANRSCSTAKTSSSEYLSGNAEADLRMMAETAYIHAR